ncbi:MAG: YdcF family protein [Lachnospiraceae bacterium]|nr:YdcF family protein [Lachnospiraceae bacterium]
MKKSTEMWLNILGTFLVLFGGFCFVYFVFLCRIMPSSSFNYVFLAAALFFMGLGFVVYYGKRGLSKMPKWLLFTIEGIVGVGCFVFVIIELIIVIYANRTPSDAEYCLILGAKVNGTSPSLSLRVRLDAAYEYLMEHPNCIAVVSGGKGDDEGISEAESMRIYLMEKGIAKERILLEDRSTTTMENMQFSKELIDVENSTVCVCTSDFHLFRACMVAKKNGYMHITGLGGRSLWYLIPTNYVREFMAIVKSILWGYM